MRPRDICACRGDIPGGLQYHLCRFCRGTSLSLIWRKHQTNPKRRMVLNNKRQRRWNVPDERGQAH